MRTAAKVTNRLLTDEVISSEEAELVQYGLENFVSTLLGLVAVLLIGRCFGHCPESFMLWLFIFPLRKSAGGFHAKTRIRCWLISLGMLITSFLLLVQIEWHNGVYIGITVFFGIVIYLMSPVENSNKRLDEMEYKVYKRRTRILLILEGILFVLAWYLHWKNLFVVITMCFMIVGISVLAGKVKLRKQQKAEKI